jgi:hypothetical protein
MFFICNSRDNFDSYVNIDVLPKSTTTKRQILVDSSTEKGKVNDISRQNADFPGEQSNSSNEDRYDSGSDIFYDRSRRFSAIPRRWSSAEDDRLIQAVNMFGMFYSRSKPRTNLLI